MMEKDNFRLQPPVGFVEATKRGFKNLFNFKGRARRSEFWWFFLPWSPIVLMGLFIIFLPIVITLCVPYRANMTDEEYMMMEMKNLPYELLGILIPVGLYFLLFLGSMIRRLHDVGVSSLWGYSAFILYCLSVIFFYAVYYYDPISIYSLLGETINEVNNEASIYAFVVPIVLLFLSLMMYMATILFCVFDGKNIGNKYGKSYK